MKYFYPILQVLGLVFSFVSVLHAQPATKLTDLNYGNPGLGDVENVFEANGRYFIQYGQLLGEETESTLVEYDPASGETTPVFPVGLTGQSGAFSVIQTNLVFGLRDMIFAWIDVPGGGIQLYRIDGDGPVLLHTAISNQFSEMVVFEEELYFLSGTLPLSQNTFGYSTIAEIWTTDGTPGGTSRKATIFNFLSTTVTQLIPGDGLLHVVLENSRERVYGYYDPADEEFLYWSEGFGQYITDYNGGLLQRSPVGLWNESLYTSDPIEGSDLPAVEVYDLADRTTTGIPLSNILPDLIPSDIVNFYPAGEDVLYVGVDRRLGGLDLLRIDRNAPTQPRVIFNSPGLGSEPVCSEAVTLLGDTVLFTSTLPGGSALLRYTPDADRLDTLFTTDYLEDRVDLVVREDFVYVLGHGNREIIRYDRRDGTTTTAAAAMEDNPSTFLLRRHPSPLVEAPDGIYFVGYRPSDDARSTNGGLFEWRDAAAQTNRLLTDYGQNQFVQLIPRGNDRSGNFYVTTGADIYVTDGADGTLIDLTDSWPDSLAPGLSGSIVFQEGLLVFGTVSTTGLATPFVLEAGELSPVRYEADGVPFPDGYFIPRYDLPEGSETDYVLGVFSPTGSNTDREEVLATLRPGGIIEILFLEQPDREYETPRVSPDRTYVLLSERTDGSETQRYTYVRTRDNFQFEFEGPVNATIAGAAEEGIFLFSMALDQFFPEPRLTYYPFDQSPRRELLFADEIALSGFVSINSPSVNGKLLFTGYSPDFGVELFVADPATERVQLLADIYPGNEGGMYQSRGYVSTESGVYFPANDGVSGQEIWVTDGTTEGTRRVTDINPGAGGSFPSQLTRYGNEVIFEALGPNGFELYNLNLDSEEATLKTDLNPGTDWGTPGNFRRVGPYLYFTGRNGTNETVELFRINEDIIFGTEADLTLLPAVVYPNPVGTAPVTIQAPDGERMVRTELFDVKGSHLRTVALMGTSGTLNLSELPAGQYFLRTWYASGKYSVNGIQRVR